MKHKYKEKTPGASDQKVKITKFEKIVLWIILLIGLFFIIRYLGRDANGYYDWVPFRPIEWSK